MLGKIAGKVFDKVTEVAGGAIGAATGGGGERNNAESIHAQQGKQGGNASQRLENPEMAIKQAAQETGVSEARLTEAVIKIAGSLEQATGETLKAAVLLVQSEGQGQQPRQVAQAQQPQTSDNNGGPLGQIANVAGGLLSMFA